MSNVKEVLRREMKRRRAGADDRAERDGKIAEYFLGLPQVARSERIFIYYSFGQEADTHAIVDELLRRGKEVYLPRVEGQEMVFVRYKGQALKKSRYGIEEPEGERTQARADAVVLPMLAADGKLHRLGYGGGYYDRFLPQAEGAVKIGICYDFQRTEKEFAESHDIPADVLVTDRGIITGKRTEEVECRR